MAILGAVARLLRQAGPQLVAMALEDRAPRAVAMLQPAERLRTQAATVRRQEARQRPAVSLEAAQPQPAERPPQRAEALMAV